MEIDFSSIVQKKLEQLKQDGIIEKMIQEDLERSIRKCIDSTIGGYALQEMIQNEMKNWISNDAKLLGLEAYNGLVANRAKAIVEAYHSNAFKAYLEENNDRLWRGPEELQ